ncbi:MAG: sugar ABC transporter permease [Alphaproteobacteria bacterium]
MAHKRSPLLYLFLALPVGYLVVLVGFPIIYNLMMSVQDVKLGNIASLSRPFVGIDNYLTAVDDPIFRGVFLNSIIFVSANVVAQVGIGLMVALFFAQRFPGAPVMRGLLLAGWMLPALVVGALWKWLFAGDFGVINYFLSAIPLIGGSVHWLSDPSFSLLSVTLANIWFGMPFSMILIAAALTGIPKEHYEAAALDGAGVFARFRFITLPALKASLLAVTCLVIIYTMRAFDLIFAMTEGGPIDSSNVLPLYAYQKSFKEFRFGLGAAMGTFAFFIVFAVALIYVRTVGKERET